MTSPLARVVVENLAVRRGERLLFRGLSFELRPGEAMALTGANGAGKTSLLRAVAGLLRPEAGWIRFEDAAGAELEPAPQLHLLGHQDGLKSGRSAREELAFQARWTGADAAGVAAAVEALGLTPLLDLDVRRLSAGQRRRLALARLVASPRPLWLLDEPMAPLDAARRAAFGEILARRLASGGLVLAAVHDPLPVPARALELEAAG